MQAHIHLDETIGVKYAILPGDPADYLPRAGGGLCPGVSGCDEGIDRHLATESDRAEHPGNTSVVAYFEYRVCGSGALCGVVDSGVGAAGVLAHHEDVSEPLSPRPSLVGAGLPAMASTRFN